MVFRHILKDIAFKRAHIHTIGENRINVVAVGGGDFDGNGFAIGNDGVGRSNGTALPCRRRHRVFVDDEHGRNGMVRPDIGESVAVGDGHCIPVHHQSRNVPSLRRNNAVGLFTSAGHRRRAGGGNRAIALCRSHNLVRIHRKSGGQRVVGNNIIKCIG